MALCTSMAATEESTPPERPQMTWPLPTFSRIAATVVSMKCAGVQSPRAPQMLRKIPISCGPSGVWCTSGWNCTAQMRRSRIFNGRQRVFGHGDAAKAGGQLQRLVAVAHPDLDRGRQPREQRRSSVFNGHLGVAVLAFWRRTDFAAQVMDDEMESIADAKDRNAQRQQVADRHPARRHRKPTTDRPKESHRWGGGPEFRPEAPCRASPRRKHSVRGCAAR